MPKVTKLSKKSGKDVFTFTHDRAFSAQGQTVPSSSGLALIVCVLPGAMPHQ
ncbi:hypothetical protein [Maribacter sp. 4G9]|uniref:hypothetical protein n=1 Tax=Maribacter sp. 4G9 TaxID=1889777 RepID=UPI0013FDD100|nr:hypothetical protein [Maribacter sp. 4G9]